MKKSQTKQNERYITQATDMLDQDLLCQEGLIFDEILDAKINEADGIVMFKVRYGDEGSGQVSVIEGKDIIRLANKTKAKSFIESRYDTFYAKEVY